MFVNSDAAKEPSKTTADQKTVLLKSKNSARCFRDMSCQHLLFLATMDEKDWLLANASISALLAGMITIASTMCIEKWGGVIGGILTYV